MKLWRHLNCTVYANSPKVNTWLSVVIVKNGFTLIASTFRKRIILTMMILFLLALIASTKSLRKLIKGKKYRNHVLQMASLVRLRNKLNLCLRNSPYRLLSPANKILQPLKKNNQKSQTSWLRKNYSLRSALPPTLLTSLWPKQPLQSKIKHLQTLKIY